MTYSKKDYTHLRGMEGFSDKALEIHFALYEGYVNSTNKILETLKKMNEGLKTDLAEFSELKRRLGWEFNGMRLHELYFGNLGGNGKINNEGNLYRSIQKSFGGYEQWQQDFTATGKMRGVGWVILYQNRQDGMLYNFWINEHDEGHPSGCSPVLVMDVFEHAFMIDYGKDRPAYIEAFMKNVNWEEAERRLV